MTRIRTLDSPVPTKRFSAKPTMGDDPNAMPLSKRRVRNKRGFAPVLLLIMMLSSSFTISLDSLGTNLAHAESFGYPVNVKAVAPQQIPVNTLPGSIPVGSEPAGIAFNSRTNLLYVTSAGSGFVSVINGSTSRVVASIKIPSATFVGVAPSSNLIFVGPGGDPRGGYYDETFLINGTSNQILDIAPNIERSTGMAVDSNRGIIYAADALAGNIFALHYNGTNLVSVKIPVDSSPFEFSSMAVNSQTGIVYVTSFPQLLFAVDPSTGGVTKIPLNVNASLVTVNPTTNTVYLASGTDTGTRISLVDGSTNKLLPKFIDINASITDASRMVTNPNNNLVYLSHSNFGVTTENPTSVINGTTNSLITTVKMPDQPNALGVNTNTGAVYVANLNTQSVSIWGPTLTEMVQVPPTASFESEQLPTNATSCCTIPAANFTVNHPADIAVNPINHLVYVADSNASLVRVLDPQNQLVVASVAVQSPHYVAVAQSADLIYASNGDVTFVIDGKTNAVVGHFANLVRSSGLAVDQSTGKAYTATVSPCGSITEMWYDGTGLVQQGIVVDESACLGDMDVNSKTGVVYAAGGSSVNDRLVYAIVPSTDSVTRIRVGVSVTSVATNPNTNLVYAAGSDDAVLVIDGGTNEVLPKFIDTLAVTTFGGFSNIVVDPNGGEVYATGLIENSTVFGTVIGGHDTYAIYVTNGTTNTLTETVPLPGDPISLQASPSTGTLYVGVLTTVGVAANEHNPGNLQRASVIEVRTRQLSFPSGVILEPLVTTDDLFPQVIGETGVFGVWYDRVTIRNIGTAQGLTILETVFVPGVNTSDIATDFKDIQVLYAENGLLEYTASVPPLSEEWLDIPIRIDPSVVNFESGPFQHEQLFQVGERYHLGATVGLASLTPQEWTGLNTNFQGTDLILHAMNMSAVDRQAFFRQISSLRAERCGAGSINGTAPQNCASLISADTRKVAPLLADYIDDLVEELPNANAINLGAAYSVDGVVTTEAVLGLTPANSYSSLIGLASALAPVPVTTPTSIVLPPILFPPIFAVCPDCNDQPSVQHISDREFQNIKTNEGYAGRDRQCEAHDYHGGIDVYGRAYSIDFYDVDVKLGIPVKGVTADCRIDAAEDYGFYNDPAGYCTTGYGHLVLKNNCQDIDTLPANNSDRERKDSLAGIKTQNDAYSLLLDDVLEAEGYVRNYVNSQIHLCQAQFDALVDFTFNVGPIGLAHSQILRKLSRVIGASFVPDYNGAGDEFTDPSNLPYPWGGDSTHPQRRAADEALFKSCSPGHCTQVVAAVDPNHLYANPVGYTRGGRVLDFMAEFENLKNATAPATNVAVVVSIDETLNLTTFTPLAVSHQDKLQNITIDNANRRITWYFADISLPPDKNPPEGEGWIRYSIVPDNNLTTGTIIQTKAKIFFDFNPPINTNVAQQIVDNDPPTTTIKALPSRTSSTSFEVQWQGTDKGSGILGVLMLVSMDNASNFQAMNMTGTNTAYFIGQPGHTYYFESIGVDRAGNVEVKSQPDTMTSIIAIQKVNPPFVLVPVIAVVLIAVVLIAAGLYYMRTKRSSRVPGPRPPALGASVPSSELAAPAWLRV